MEENLITFKIKYTVEEDEKSSILSMIKNYNNILRYTYNRVQEGILSTKELTKEQSKLKNIILDSHFKNSAIYEAKALKEKKLIFGGKKLFLDRCQNKISKEEFQIKKLFPLCSIGETLQKGNRKFNILTDSQILFKPNRDIHICLNLESVGKKRAQELQKLIILQNNCVLPITYKLDLDYIYIIFDYSKLKENNYKIKQNRVLALDLNPNYIGLSVVDWLAENKYNIVYSEVISNKPLNDYEKSLQVNNSDEKKTYITNKRDYEIIQIAYRIAKLCKHYKCEICSIEDLNIKSKDLDKGKRLNRLVNNQWNRNKFTNILSKLIKSSSTKLIKVKANYSSFIGNLVYREERLPDMVLASIELSRRAYEFNLQYIKKTKIPEKNIILPKIELVRDKVSKSLEELKIESQFEDLEELYLGIKKSKQKYRFLLEEIESARVFSKFYKKRYGIFYTFV